MAPSKATATTKRGGENWHHGVAGTSDHSSLHKKRCLCVDDVPAQYKEKYINTNYRRPYSSASECILSAFTLNNETFNIWTHFLPLIFLSIQFYRTFPSDLIPLTSIPTRYYPLITMELSVCTYLLGSTLAHTFNCMTPRIRHICFYVDYAAISTFGIGGACANVYYMRPLNTGFFLLESPNLYLCGATLCNVFSAYIMCASRHKWEPIKYVIRTLAATLAYLYGNSPTYVRLLLCLYRGEECYISHVYFFFGWVSYLVAGILNATRVPEKYIPNTFDVFGHNHQWVHVITTLGTLCLFWGVQVELEERKELLPVLLEGVTLWSSMGWMLVTLVLSGSFAVWFGSRLDADGSLKLHTK